MLQFIESFLCDLEKYLSKEGEKIDYSVEKELKEWVENQERNMSEEECLRLLYKYQEYVERNQ